MLFSEYSEKLLQKRVRKAFIYVVSQSQGVEMKVASFRALTQFHDFELATVFLGENEGRLFQGIDTM